MPSPGDRDERTTGRECQHRRNDHDSSHGLSPFGRLRGGSGTVGPTRPISTFERLRAPENLRPSPTHERPTCYDVRERETGQSEPGGSPDRGCEVARSAAASRGAKSLSSAIPAITSSSRPCWDPPRSDCAGQSGRNRCESRGTQNITPLECQERRLGEVLPAGGSCRLRGQRSQDRPPPCPRRIEHPQETRDQRMLARPGEPEC